MAAEDRYSHAENTAHSAAIAQAAAAAAALAASAALAAGVGVRVLTGAAGGDAPTAGGGGSSKEPALFIEQVTLQHFEVALIVCFTCAYECTHSWCAVVRSVRVCSGAVQEVTPAVLASTSRTVICCHGMM
jgi:hypothetical protein